MKRTLDRRGIHRPLPAVLKWALRYPNVFQARDTLESLPAGKGLDVCASCASCVARCRGRVDIGRRVGQLKIHFA